MNKHIIAVILFSIALVFFWNTWPLFPLKLLVVLMHETSHAIAALVTGGSVEKIMVNRLQGGLTFVRGGNTFVTASAGYLGSSLIGAIVLLASVGRLRNRLAEILGFVIIVITIIWVRDLFTLAFAIGMGMICIVVGRKTTAWLKRLFLQLIGSMCCLYAVYDISADILSVRRLVGAGSSHKNDAQIIAEITGIPAVIWGALWITIAAVVFLFTLWRLRLK